MLTYRVNAALALDADVRIVAFTPHMHLRGKAFEYHAVFPDGGREVLLRVPKYGLQLVTVVRLGR